MDEFADLTGLGGADVAAMLVPATRLSKDLLLASKVLSEDEARFLVDAYYALQRDRIRAGHQERSLAKAEEPNSVLAWLGTQSATLEKQIQRALDAYSNSVPAGRWARSVCGIGPVIAAGLLAHIDIERAPTAGHIWRFAGLDPTQEWKKGAKRPWNGALKRLCWIIGESFVKVSGNESDVYGKIYKGRKELEQARNEAGQFADQAAAALTKKNFGKDTDAFKAYSIGKLPPARIHLRAQRYAVKLFLSHLHQVMFELHYGRMPEKPYIFHDPKHTHLIPPPNWPMD